MGKKSTPAPPDLRPYADAMRATGEWGFKTAQEQLAWAREQDAANRDILNQVLAVQLPAAQQQFENAQKDRTRYEQTFQPIEDELVKDFQSYGTPERMGMERGRAIADVTAAFDAQRNNALQRLEGYGVDPSQTRNAALDVGVRTTQAAAQAAAATNATRIAEDKSRAMRADAINIGKGMPSQVAQSYGQAVAAGSQGVGGANQTFGTSAGAIGSPGSFGNMAQSGYRGASDITNQGFQNQMQQYNAQQAANAQMMSGVGSALGMAAMIRDGGKPGNAPQQAIPTSGHIAGGPGNGSGIDDRVPAQIVNPQTGTQTGEARLSTNEYIIPADVVRAKGVEFFDKLLERYHTPADQQRYA